MEITKGKKATLIWTKGLHKKFQEAVEKLGIDNASPMKILELMKVDGLTRDHVSSYLQKYRMLLKKIANDNSGVQTASKPSLLESSMTNNDASWNNASSMLNREQMNMPNYSGMHTSNSPILNTSSSLFPFHQHSGSLPTEGYAMQVRENNLVDQGNLIYDTTSMGVVNSLNSSNFWLLHNLDGFHHECGGISTEVFPYNNIVMGSSSGMNMSKGLTMSWDQENPIHIGNLSNSSFVENSNGFKTSYSTQSDLFQMGSSSGSKSKGNLETGIREEDLMLTEADIACLLSFSDDNSEYERTLNINAPVTPYSPNQDVTGQNFQDVLSYALNNNEETPSIKQYQTLHGYPGFDPTFSQCINEQFMESFWSPEPLGHDMPFKVYF